MDSEEDLDQEAVSRLKEMVPNLTSITLSGHSYGLEACKFIGGILADAPKIKVSELNNLDL